ncbi:MAG TPA: DUF4159 domain-containing protein [Opitutaceae bacterium]|nr:DUF4159 domain-containing protein [Opitutaceae bacterium]
MKKTLRTFALFLVLGVLVFAQRWGGGEGGYVSEDTKTAREIASHSTGTPEWTNPKGFEKDVFTFVRIRYSSGGYGAGGFRRRSGAGWTTDLPDSDLNLSYRLQQMTSMKVDPDGRIIRVTDPEMAEYPFIYIVEPGRLSFDDKEVAALRKYLLNGGFLMLDDFWGDSAWENVEAVFKQVFPERNFNELSLEHPLYHCVFEIKSKGQVPNVGTGINHQHDPEGQTWENQHDGDVRTVHHRAITDDKGRIMVLATHNTDNGDGWEREGESDYYFHNFSEKIAYPLGINIVFYVMTH